MSLSIRKYLKSECITFKSTKGKYGSLSNMAANYPIYIGKIFIYNSEALYQALRFPDYPEIQYEILKFKSPISAKKFSRLNNHKTRKDWNYTRFQIMKFCIELKLYQNWSQFSNDLIDTQDFYIVEYSEKDKVWGATDEGEYYEGTNALGRLLMELREKVLSNSFNLSIPKIDNLKLLNVYITSELLKNY